MRAPDFIDQNLLGRSPLFLQAVGLIRRIAAYEVPVLIQGETGTGKELAARAVHYLGKRNGRAFVAVNCGAIPETLVEGEFFGHVRGAFTDAKESRAGLVAQARGGTLFLDELEALSSRGQVALLRFLQDQEYRPLGGSVVRDADVRLIASTNRDLHTLAAKGAYRADLLFRLSVFVLDLPPLRDRPGDAQLLADHFVERFSVQHNRPAKGFDHGSLEYLKRYSWPGNVRELANHVQREFLLSEGPQISLGGRAAPEPREYEKEPAALAGQRFRQAKAQAIAEFERAYVTEVLRRSQGNISLAARLSGKERSRFGKLLKKYGLERGAFRSDGQEA